MTHRFSVTLTFMPKCSSDTQCAKFDALSSLIFQLIYEMKVHVLFFVSVQISSTGRESCLC